MLFFGLCSFDGEEAGLSFSQLILFPVVGCGGVIEWESNQIIEACQVADRLGLIKPVADQCEYNLCARDKVEMDYKPVFERYGYGTTIWSPLASGVLTGKKSRQQPYEEKEREKTGPEMCCWTGLSCSVGQS